MSCEIRYDDCLWREGLRGEGGGWGDGMECLIWGYGIDGSWSGLNMVGMVNGSGWGKEVSGENGDGLMNFLGGGRWYYGEGYGLGWLEGNCYEYGDKEEGIGY